MWQIDPDTAREEGLVVTADYDGRLDIAASTTAALSLIERYEKEFGDWRLADMAFNSGEYRVKNLLKGRDAHSLTRRGARQARVQSDHARSPGPAARALVRRSPIPQRFGVTLPELDPGQRLKIDHAAIGHGRAARRAPRRRRDGRHETAQCGVPAQSHGRRACRTSCLMPAASVERFQAAAQAIPVALWNDWREQRAARTSGLASWAAEVGIPVAVLAAANAIGESATVGPTTQLLLPGRDKHAEDAPAAPTATHVVKSGDTLSSIAHRYGVPLAEIKRMNPKACTPSRCIRAIACASPRAARTELRLG